jgi:hypothetical protein
VRVGVEGKRGVGRYGTEWGEEREGLIGDGLRRGRREGRRVKEREEALPLFLSNFTPMPLIIFGKYNAVSA